MKLSTLFSERYLPYAERTLKPKTAAEYKRLAEKVILPALGERLIATLDIGQVEDWHAAVPGAVQANRALAVLSAALAYAVNRRLISSNPCRGLHRNKERNREFFYTPAQTKAILAAAAALGSPEAKAISLALLTGARPGELLDARPEWRQGSVLQLPDSKTGARTIFLSGAACAILDNLPIRQDGRYFQPGLNLRRTWERTVKTAGVPVARLYDLRHTFASSALAAGVSLAVIGQMLGHRKAQTTMRYIHLAPDAGLEAVAKAAQRMGAAS